MPLATTGSGQRPGASAASATIASTGPPIAAMFLGNRERQAAKFAQPLQPRAVEHQAMRRWAGAILTFSEPFDSFAEHSLFAGDQSVHATCLRSSLRSANRLRAMMLRCTSLEPPYMVTARAAQQPGRHAVASGPLPGRRR